MNHQGIFKLLFGAAVAAAIALILVVIGVPAPSACAGVAACDPPATFTPIPPPPTATFTQPPPPPTATDTQPPPPPPPTATDTQPPPESTPTFTPPPPPPPPPPPRYPTRTPRPTATPTRAPAPCACACCEAGWVEFDTGLEGTTVRARVADIAIVEYAEDANGHPFAFVGMVGGKENVADGPQAVVLVQNAINSVPACPAVDLTIISYTAIGPVARRAEVAVRHIVSVAFATGEDGAQKATIYFGNLAPTIVTDPASIALLRAITAP